ncbi:MAG TPA: MFS transporter [Candidatus Dormibacteraeota bacterium]|nr:MFS transporter [Candidatus Dormibacteraeota bacterium]
MNKTDTLSHESTRSTAATAGERATNVRWRILGIIMFIMAVTALNRLNLSIAGKYIEDEFSFDIITMGRIFSSFLWGYALFQIPWGYICDRIGPRRTLTAAILCFAAGAAAMGVAPKLAESTGFSVFLAMRVVRFFTGVGEAAVSSNVTRVIASWTAVKERGFASGLQVCGLGLGGTLTPIFIAWTMVHWGWRAAFYICAMLAFLAVLIWNFYAKDWPEEHASVNDTELQLVHPGSQRGDVKRRETAAAKHVPWFKMISSLSVWGLILGYGCQGYGFYVYYHWFYFYAVKVRGLPIMQAALWTSAPFLAMALLAPVGGWFSDRVARRSNRRRGLRTAVWLGMGVSAVLLLIGSHLPVTSIALPMIALAAGFNMFAAANFWAACIDLAPDYAASLSALMNTLGSVGGALSSTATAYVAVHYSWSHSLDLAAVITVISGLLFTLVDARKSIEEKSA